MKDRFNYPDDPAFTKRMRRDLGLIILASWAVVFFGGSLVIFLLWVIFG